MASSVRERRAALSRLAPGPVAEVYERPKHAYTKRLLAAEPKPKAAHPPGEAPVLLRARNLKVWFPIKAGVFHRTVAHVKAVDGVSIAVRQGRIQLRRGEAAQRRRIRSSGRRHGSGERSALQERRRIDER